MDGYRENKSIYWFEDFVCSWNTPKQTNKFYRNRVEKWIRASFNNPVLRRELSPDNHIQQLQLKRTKQGQKNEYTLITPIKQYTIRRLINQIVPVRTIFLKFQFTFTFFTITLSSSSILSSFSCTKKTSFWGLVLLK